MATSFYTELDFPGTQENRAAGIAVIWIWSKLTSGAVNAQGTPASCLFVKRFDRSGLVTPWKCWLWSYVAGKHFETLRSWILKQEVSPRKTILRYDGVQQHREHKFPYSWPGSQALFLGREVRVSNITAKIHIKRKLSQILYLNHVNLLGMSLRPMKRFFQ